MLACIAHDSVVVRSGFANTGLDTSVEKAKRGQPLHLNFGEFHALPVVIPESGHPHLAAEQIMINGHIKMHRY